MNIESGAVGIRVRCAAHNHVFEIYTSYTHNGEVVIDLVPCPQCRDHMDNEILPLKLPAAEEQLINISALLDEHNVPKTDGLAVYSTYGRVSWLARKAHQFQEKK